jgi:hypothetical protein
MDKKILKLHSQMLGLPKFNRMEYLRGNYQKEHWPERVIQLEVHLLSDANLTQIIAKQHLILGPMYSEQPQSQSTMLKVQQKLN